MSKKRRLPAPSSTTAAETKGKSRTPTKISAGEAKEATTPGGVEVEGNTSDWGQAQTTIGHRSVPRTPLHLRRGHTDSYAGMHTQEKLLRWCLLQGCATHVDERTSRLDSWQAMPSLYNWRQQYQNDQKKKVQERAYPATSRASMVEGAVLAIKSVSLFLSGKPPRTKEPSLCNLVASTALELFSR